MEKVRITFDGQEIEVEVEKMAEYKRIEGSVSSRRVVEWRRVDRVKKAAENEMIPYPGFVVVAPDPFDVIMEKELKARIDAAVDKLPPRQKEAFILVHYEGRSLKEAAKEMSIAFQNVHKLLQKAVKNLKYSLDIETLDGF